MRQPRTYAERKAKEAQRQARLSAAGREIGALPPVADPARKSAGLRSFKLFCEAYFPDVFSLPWSDDHIYTIGRIENAATTGGRFACAMPRATGKTALCEVACIWAAVRGLRQFIMLFAASQTTASERLETIKSHLFTNELLAADFPEVCHPIRKLENIANRSKGQLYRGKSTAIQWKQRQIVLPTIAGSPASGTVIRAAGLDSEFRGANFKTQDALIRPDLAIIDDPQTDESAKSPNQCDDRERRIKGGILGLAGPKKRIAAVMPCTVIYPGDLADRMLDRTKNPEWNGHRSALLRSFPKHTDLWEKYWEIRSQSLQADGDGSEATEFYRQNRAAMDEGADPSWPARHNDDELSATQYAMNLYLSDPPAFYSEYQNDPILSDDQAEQITRDEILRKTNGHQVGVVPKGAAYLTAHVDVMKRALYYMVCAWEPDFTGSIVDYGTHPKQNRSYFTLRDIRQTLTRKHPGLALEGMLYAALDALCGAILAKEWPRDGGGVARVDRCGIDANWGESTDVVYRFCRQSKIAQNLRPLHGRYIGAAGNPIVYPGRKPRPGEIVGDQWIMPPLQTREARHITFDANHWKTVTHARLSTPIGEAGALTLHEGDHRMLADHLVSEFPQRVTARDVGRSIDEWRLYPGRENHWWDNLVGNVLLAATIGVALGGARIPSPRQQRRRPRKATSL